MAEARTSCWPGCLTRLSTGALIFSEASLDVFAMVASVFQNGRVKAAEPLMA